MRRSVLSRSARGALGLATLLPWALPAEARQTASESFEPGIQWSDVAQDSAPWIPTDVAAAAQGELVWVGRGYGGPAAALHGAQEEWPGSLIGLDLGWSNSVGGIEVEAVGDGLFALGQVSLGAARRTRVERSTATAVGPVVDWSVELPWTVDGGAVLVASETTLGVVERLDSNTLRVCGLDAADGSILATSTLTGGILRAVDLAPSENRLLVVAGDSEYHVSLASGQVELARTHPDVPRCAALSPDGASVALGFPGRVERWGSEPSDAAPFETLVGQPSDVAVALDLGPELLAVGWWSAVDARTLHLDLWEFAGVDPARLEQRVVVGGSTSGPQNFVSAVELAGERAAFGTWGADGSEPELFLLERGGSTPILEVDLAGSVLALDLDSAAERLFVARKQGHANDFGTVGAVELIDTGERDLALSATPTGGSALTILVRGLDPEKLGWVLFGLPAGPSVWPGVQGVLELDPMGPLSLLAVGVDGSAAVTVPSTAAGLEIGLQPLWITTAHEAGFGSTSSAIKIL